MPLKDKVKESHKKWDDKNLKRTSVALPIDLHDRMIRHTEKTGETKNGFIKRAIDETITRESR